MALVEKVEGLLKKAFPPPDRIVLEDDDGIIGLGRFGPFPRAWDGRDRIDMIWDVLDQGLTKQERRRVVTIVAVTPEEETRYESSD